MTKVPYDQWTVTADGIRSVIPYAPYVYKVPAEDLVRIRVLGESKFYFWLLQVADKSWADIESFIVAFCLALVIHKSQYDGVEDKVILLASCREARKVAGEVAARSAGEPIFLQVPHRLVRPV